MDSIGKAYQFLLDIAQNGPLGEHAFIVALVASWSAAYLMRFWQPEIPVRTRDMMVAYVQLAVGWIVTVLFWHTLWGVIVGFICGASAPFIWGAILGIADWKFPRFAAAMRGVPSQPDKKS